MLRTPSMCTLVSGLLLIGSPTPAAPADKPSDSQRVNAVLESIATKPGLSAFVGHGPERCVVTGAGTEVCEWWMGNRDSGWAPLARAIQTRSRLSLICELPSDMSPRGFDSCGAHPRASNRGQWKRRKRQYLSSSPKQRDRYEHPQQRARNLLDSARTLAALSHLVGAAPDECRDADAGQRICIWKANSRTWGHGTLVTVIETYYRKKVRLRCNLPSDGSRREAYSCQVDIGS